MGVRTELGSAPHQAYAEGIRLSLYHRPDPAWASTNQQPTAVPCHHSTPVRLRRPRWGWERVQLTCSVCRRRVDVQIGSQTWHLWRVAWKALVLSSGVWAGVAAWAAVGESDLGQCLLVCGATVWVWALIRLFPDDAACVYDPLGQHTILP